MAIVQELAEKIDGKLLVADSYIDIESLKKLPGYLFL